MYNNNLQYAREELEITQTELGRFLGVHKSTISCWENGYNVIPFRKLLKFCNHYHYSLDFICGLNRKNTYYKLCINPKEIGNNLKKIRKKLKLTQVQVAKECSISQTTYNTYESGLYFISTMTLYTICKNHQLSMDELIKEDILIHE